ncbi:MAG: YcaO-like family protein [bacterium]|nr:YcaO-like family protein [bacterium]
MPKINEVTLKPVLLFRAWLLKSLVETIEDIIGAPYSKFSSATSRLTEALKADGFIKSWYTADFLPDEPRFMMMGARYGDLVNNSDAGFTKMSIASGPCGADFYDYDKAAMRCLGEAVERTCLSFYQNKDLIFGSFKELQDRGAINPNSFVSFSDSQLKEEKFELCRFGEDSRFGWVKGESLINGKNILVPAQLVYLSYTRNHREEPMIRRAISTGGAAHRSMEEALYRGVCEVIERDSWMIFWLNKLSPPVIDLENAPIGKIRKLSKLFKRYNLELYVLDFKTDIGIPTFCTLIIDRTGIGPAVVVANKTDLDSERALLGSVAEALKSWWGRKRRMRQATGLQERGFLWSTPDMIPRADFLTKGPKVEFQISASPKESKKKLGVALEYFKKNNMEVAAVDITIPEAKWHGFYSTMVLIPGLQPMYLNEDFPYLGGNRLYQVPVKLGYFQKPKLEAELNQITHPHV